MRKDGGDGVVVSQLPLVEEAVARRVRVLGSLEDMAVRALAMDVGVSLGLAVGVDRKKAKACRGEEPKDVAHLGSSPRPPSRRSVRYCRSALD